MTIAYWVPLVTGTGEAKSISTQPPSLLNDGTLDTGTLAVASTVEPGMAPEVFVISTVNGAVGAK